MNQINDQRGINERNSKKPTQTLILPKKPEPEPEPEILPEPSPELSPEPEPSPIPEPEPEEIKPAPLEPEYPDPEDPPPVKEVIEEEKYVPNLPQQCPNKLNTVLKDSR